MKIGYARVSAPHQNLDRQIAALRAEGCDRIFREKASGRDLKGRPQLEKAIDALPKRGVLVLAEWDRCTRSMLDEIQIIERVYSRGAFVKVLDKPHLDLTTTIGRGFLAFLSALAQDKRERIVKRANEGRVVARRRGAAQGGPLSAGVSDHVGLPISWTPSGIASAPDFGLTVTPGKCRVDPSVRVSKPLGHENGFRRSRPGIPI